MPPAPRPPVPPPPSRQRGGAGSQPTPPAAALPPVVTPRPQVVGAIDQGTQSTRFFLYDGTGSPVCSHQVELEQIYPRAGWCEHDPTAILAGVAAAVEGCLAKAPAGVEVVALGITNQRETTVVWDRATGAPLHNAVVWHDTRTSDLCREIEADVGKEHFRLSTGLPVSTYFSAVKVKWMMEQVPGVQEALHAGTALVGTVDSWLLWNLTGGPAGGRHVTDVTNASRTLLMDLRRLAWDEQACGYFGIPPACLPRIVSNAEEYGRVASGPLAGVPVTGCLGDQQAATLGQRCRAGEAKNTYGTGCFLILNTGPEVVQSRHGLLTTVAFQLGAGAPADYGLEGAVAVAGAGISWLKNNLGLISEPAESESLARTVEDSAGVYFVPAFSGLLAPHWREDARGVIVGLTQYTTRAHICRAMLDAMAFQTKEVINAMEQDSRLAMTALRVDGGATQNALLMQIQADVLGVPVVRPENAETTSRGAAFAAGLAVGFYSREDVFSEAGGERARDTVFQPRMERRARAAAFSGWLDAVERSLGLAPGSRPPRASGGGARHGA